MPCCDERIYRDIVTWGRLVMASQCTIRSCLHVLVLHVVHHCTSVFNDPQPYQFYNFIVPAKLLRSVPFV